uniref:Uncharacterized protein n=1 Tax=Arundo donax TaxID=35708 RepID=A0A0A9D2L3_ARUDO
MFQSSKVTLRYWTEAMISSISFRNYISWWRKDSITCGIGTPGVISRIPHPIFSLLLGCQRSTTNRSIIFHR